MFGGEKMDYTDRFSGKGEIYAKARPKYAQGLFEYFSSVMNIPNNSTGNGQLLVLLFCLCYNSNKGGDRYGNKRCNIEFEDKNGAVSRCLGRKGARHTAGGVSLGKW